MDNKNYYLGLDIGTDSIGWAVTDMEYNVVRKKGKSLWGIRLFEEAKTAEDRRLKRTVRRRNDRKKERIRLLQELFSNEINKVDSKFFSRLRDSAFWADDKEENQIYSLFNDTDFKDYNYYDKYKTIYHLRKSLLVEDEKKDIRLLYLAIHHMMKNRGHFLFNGDVDNVTSFKTTYDAFKYCLEDEFEVVLECQSEEKFEEILKDKKKSKSEKQKEIEKLCNISKEDKQIKEIIKLIVGLKGNLSVVFNDSSFEDNEHNKISFAEGDYDALRANLESEIYEKVNIIDIFNNVYNWVILSDILNGGEYEGNSYLSVAKVNIYDKHGKDLGILKEVVKKYLSKEEYNNFFVSEGSNNYSAYVGKYTKNGIKLPVKKIGYDDFAKTLKSLLKKITVEDEKVDIILKEVENGTFLPLQVSKNNGIIPYQVNKMELASILRKAEKHYPFLKEVDESCNKTVSEKIVDIFEFRVPYYVGPLNINSKNAWIVKRNNVNEKIRPWNFEKVVDVDASAAEFINKMTNQCTYLTKETVLPKFSLLYCEFMVLNEINNLRIKGEKISVELKKEIFENLFKSNKQVTGKKLLGYLNSLGYDLQKGDLSGFDGEIGNFKASLSSYITFKGIFGEDMDKYSVQKMVEDLILWITLYGDAPHILKRVIKKNYPEITDEQLKKISKLRFNGWGRLSRAFLENIQGIDCETGQGYTIIQGLRDTQNNLMQLLSQKYSFSEEIQKANGDSFDVSDEITYDNLVKDIPASPLIKRAVWQTVQIVEEVRKIMGCEPKRVFVEVARAHEKIKKRTESRKNQLLELYKNIKEENAQGLYEEILKRDEREFKNIKLYLYYTQMGRCMYTGERISLSNILNADVYDRDHIYPQSKTKDDSLNNLVYVRKDVNAKKSDGLISAEIRSKMYSFWKQLKDNKLISDEKFSRLTRTTPLTDEELAGFINRQLVEVRQSTKIVAQLLERIYEDTKIVYVKANSVSDFRKEECENGVKTRIVNDYHHAKDAYLNIVVGNVYFNKFTDNPLHWLRNNKDKKYSLKKMYDFDIQNKDGYVWKRGKDGTIVTVNKYMERNDILYTRYAHCNKGEFFNQMPVKAPVDENKGQKLVPRKAGLAVTKYGGYNRVTPAYFALVESKDKKGNLIRSIEIVPLYLAKDIEKDENIFLEYCEKYYYLTEPKIILPKIKKDALLVFDGFPMHLRGHDGVRNIVLQGAVQLCLDNKYMEYAKKIEKFVADKIKNKNLTVNDFMKLSKEENTELFDVLVSKLENTIYRLRPANIVNKIKDKRDIFIDLPVEKQCDVLSEMFKLFQCKPLTANLVGIKESANAGNVARNKTISGYNSVILVHQSPTGVFEHRVDLLKL